MMSKKITFEEAMKKLEDSVSRLESGELSLDASIEEFEECVKLIGLCEKKLSDAKQKVRILIESEDGTVTDRPFSTDEDDET
ncbi:MAG: exodeoxyribonuclease VII small subunit [Clostridia bacterium]|nr:exodeoxyribonuclease VII small subunit [Clostridia bacterium]